MYLSHFKLKQDPFSLTPLTSLYCNIPQYEETLRTIQFALQQHEGFFLVTADIGLGKTFMARKLITLLEKTNKCHTCYIYNPSISLPSLEKMIAVELGANISTENNLYQAIHERLLSIRENGKRITLVVDEAQTMSDENLEFIRLLTNLETEKSKLVQVIMFGQLELIFRLKQSHLKQLRQRIVYHRQLKPLTLSECSYYLKKRISLSGANPDLILPRNTRKKIWMLSKGNPREINILCKRAFLSAFSRNASSVKKKDACLAHKEIQANWDPSTHHRFKKFILIVLCIIFLSIISAIFLHKRYL